MAAQSFHLFSQLPQELQLKIWEDSVAGPAMQIFDVCYPSTRRSSRSRQLFGQARDSTEKRFDTYKDSVFLDMLDEEPTLPVTSRATPVARYQHDPSAYHHRESLQLTTRAARAASRIRSNANTVHLPGRSRRVQYDNARDVLFLRFRSIDTTLELAAPETTIGSMHDVPRSLEDMAEVLGGQWSPQLAETLQTARRIAIDAAETWAPPELDGLGTEEIAYLACCLQQELEVLYLVDHCTGRCKRCGRQDVRAADLQTRGELIRDLWEDVLPETNRPADAFVAVGKTYREVFDLEALGWHIFHPAYMFAKIMSGTILEQQRGLSSPVFKGVRVLVVEEESLPGSDSCITVDCGAEHAIESPVPGKSTEPDTT